MDLNRDQVEKKRSIGNTNTRNLHLVNSNPTSDNNSQIDKHEHYHDYDVCRGQELVCKQTTNDDMNQQHLNNSTDDINLSPNNQESSLSESNNNITRQAHYEERSLAIHLKKQPQQEDNNNKICISRKRRRTESRSANESAPTRARFSNHLYSQATIGQATPSPSMMGGKGPWPTHVVLLLMLLLFVVCCCQQTFSQVTGHSGPNKLLSSRKLNNLQQQHQANPQTPLLGQQTNLQSQQQQQNSSLLSTNGKLLVCYYTNWSQYRPKEGKYVPEDMDPHLCTHLIFAFGSMKKNKLAPFDTADDSKDGKKGLYERVTSLKLINPNLKVLLAVGGWSFGTEAFKTMAANKYNRQVFTFSAIEFLRERNFDGLDIDWEFPHANDKKNFVDLLRELREAFEAEAKEKHLPRLLITCAVSGGAETIKAGYDVGPIGQYVDFINVMSYDFHGKWEHQTGHNAPLFASSSETEWRKQLSMDYGIKLWEKLGAPKTKLVVGLATYGRSFTLASGSSTGMNVKTKGGGKQGEFTREEGFLAFYEICDMLKKGAAYYWDEEQAVPYAVLGDQWVGFDDELSIRNKIKWLNEQGYAGAMVWTVDMDDYRGTCTPKKYPLIRAMAEGLFKLPARPSLEWRSIIEAARQRAKAATTAAASSTALSPAIVSAVQLATGAAGSTQNREELVAALTKSIINSAGINNPATAEAIRLAITALGPATAGANGGVSSLVNGVANNITITNALTSPSVLAAITATNPQLAAQLSAAQNRSLDSTNARIVCYYTNWSYKRPGTGKFGPENLDPNLCTHIIYAFYGLKDSKLVPTEEIDNSDNEQAPYKRIIALKQLNPSLRVMLAVGGWMMGYAPFRQLTENSFRQTLFIFEVIEFLRKNKFDGLDLCWEFPRGLDDREKFSNLVKELRESFDGEAKSSGKPRLILSAAVPASFEAIAVGYDVPVINKYLDFMNVMTYDFHGDWEQVVGHNSPLYPLNSATAYQKKLTLDFSAAEWVKQGASKENLVIGLPTYGRTFTLANPNLTDIDAPAAHGGRPGQFTKESGFLSFFEVCEMLKSQATLVWDNEQMIPYAYKGDQWVGFDDPRSFKMKVQWLKQNGYSGIMIWSVDMDDFTGSCMGLRYPLIKSAKEELKGYYVANLNEVAQGSSLYSSIDGLKDKDELLCEETDGHITYHKDKKDCTMYYMCEGSRKHHMPCPQNLVFNQNGNVCDWPENVEGCGPKTPAPATR